MMCKQNEKSNLLVNGEQSGLHVTLQTDYGMSVNSFRLQILWLLPEDTHLKAKHSNKGKTRSSLLLNELQSSTTPTNDQSVMCNKAHLVGVELWGVCVLVHLLFLDHASNSAI
jgi:hypothetical protein